MMFLPWQSLKIRRKPFDRTECIYIFFCFPVDGVVDNLKCVAQQIWRLFPSLLLCREDDRGNATMSHRGHKVYCSPQCLFSIMDWKKIKKKINHIQHLCHSLKIMTVFFLKRFLNDWFYCNWVRHMRGKYISWKENLCMMFAFIFASGLNGWSNIFHTIPAWSTNWAYFLSWTCTHRWVLDLVYSFSVQIMSILCLFSWLLKWKVIPTSNHEINYTINDKKNTHKKKPPKQQNKPTYI